MFVNLIITFLYGKINFTGGVPDVPKCLYGGIRIPQLYGLWLVQN